MDTTRTTTDANGFFQLGSAAPSDSLAVEFDVRPPGRRGYTVSGLPVEVIRHRGWAQDLGIWVDQPYYSYVGEFVRRCSARRVLSATNVRFDPEPGTLQKSLLGGRAISLDAEGRFALFGDGLVADTTADLKGTITATVGGEKLASGVTIKPTVQYRAPVAVLQVSLSPESALVGCIYDRATVSPVAGIAVNFRPVDPSSANVTLSATTDSVGLFALHPGDGATGPVIGDLTIHSPPPSATYTVENVELFASGDPNAASQSSFGVGLHFPYFGIVHRGGARVPGVTLDVYRMSGAATEPDTITLRSDANGQFVLFGMHPTSVGTVVLDIVVTDPESGAQHRVRGVELPALDEDAGGRLFLMFDFDHPDKPAILIPASAPRLR